MECTYASNIKIEKDIKYGSTLEVVVEYFRKRGIKYAIYSNHGQEISLPLIKEHGYEIFHPVNIFVGSDDKKVSLFVKEYELMTFEFDEYKRLKKTSCEKIFTGP